MMITIRLADYADAADAAALVDLLDAYARDPAGGGEALADVAKQRLVSELAARPHAFSILAWSGSEPVGLVNCLEGFSTFAARPLVNVHDVVVREGWRGHGVGARMLALAEQESRRRGAVKMTLEVLSGNQPAWSLYQRLGFAPYQLRPEMGEARFLQKWLGEP